MSRLRENLAVVRQRIADAATKSGRTADDVTLVAVTKYVGEDLIEQLVQAGCLDLGEARPQAPRESGFGGGGGAGRPRRDRY